MAHLLRHHASKIFLLSNKEEHASEAIAKLKDWGDISAVEWKQCDLADINQTRDVALKLQKEIKQLDALICNAGLGVGKYWETKDGLGKSKGEFKRCCNVDICIDSHFQVNHLSQMYITLALLPVLKATPNARIVCQSSEFHRGAPSSTKFASKEEMNQDIGPSNLYARSKLAQVLFVRALHRREVDPSAHTETPPNPSDTIWVNATHPGGVETPQQEQAKEAYGTLGKVGVAIVRPFLTDPVKMGCRSALFAATSPDIVSEGINGQYIVPDRELKSVSKQGQDRKLEDALWELSEKLLDELLVD